MLESCLLIVQRHLTTDQSWKGARQRSDLGLPCKDDSHIVCPKYARAYGAIPYQARLTPLRSSPHYTLHEVRSIPPAGFFGFT